MLFLLGVTLVILVAAKWASWQYIRSHTSFRAPAGVTTAVFGTSLGETALDDSILTTWKNYCHSATGFIYHRRSLERVLAENPGVDTVVIVYGVRTFASSDDGARKYVAEARNKNPWNAQLHLSDFSSFSLRELAAMLLSADLQTALQPTPYGFSENPLTYRPDGKWSGQWYDEQLRLHHGSRSYPYVAGPEGRRDCCKEMADYCLRRGKTVIIMNTPTYHISRWIDDRGYRDYIATYDRRVRVADYSDFQMPDSTYFADVHHLNGRGAELLSRHIRSCGLRLQSIREYTGR